MYGPSGSGRGARRARTAPPIATAPVAQRADEGGPEGEGELIDPHDQRDQSAEAVARPRPELRRPVRHRRIDHADLLSPDLSGEARQVAQRRLLPDGGRRRAGGVSPVPALPSRGRSGNPGLPRRRGQRHARAASHHGRISRRRPDGRRPRRRARHDDPSPAPAVRPLRGRVADGGGGEPPGCSAPSGSSTRPPRCEGSGESSSPRRTPCRPDPSARAWRRRPGRLASSRGRPRPPCRRRSSDRPSRPSPRACTR